MLQTDPSHPSFHSPFSSPTLFHCQVRRLKEFGVTHGELTRYLKALLKDSEQLAAMIDNIPSIDNLDFIMESDALGHVIMDQQQGHECLSAVADSVSLEDVSSFTMLTLGLFWVLFTTDLVSPSGDYALARVHTLFPAGILHLSLPKYWIANVSQCVFSR
jgi:hypothetical protein